MKPTMKRFEGEITQVPIYREPGKSICFEFELHEVVSLGAFVVNSEKGRETFFQFGEALKFYNEV